MQGIQLISYQMEKLESEFRMKHHALMNQKQNLESLAKSLRPEYESLIHSLAEKYGVQDASKMAIDADTGVIRDLGAGT